jgi:hypothetical protein
MMGLNRKVVTRFLVGAVLLAPAVVAVSLAEGQSPRPGGPNPAAQAARTRQDRVKTLTVEYKRTEVTSRGAISAAWPHVKAKGPVPANETTLESVSRLLIAGDKFRYEENHPAFALPSGAINRRSMVFVFDDTLGKALLPCGARGDGNPVGVIERGAADFKVKVIHLMPLTITFRGLSPQFSSFVVSDMKPTGVTLPIEGVKCAEYTITYSPNRVERFWLDPSKDYVVKRHQRALDQTDITYRRHDTWGWIPTSWKRVEYSSAKTVATSMTINVLDIRINEPQADEQFELQFPPGCYVEDHRNNKPYRVQEDGRMREVSWSGEELSTTVDQPGLAWYQRHQWLLISAGALAVVFSGMFLVRRVMRRIQK